MRRTIIALTAILMAPTGVLAAAARGELIVDTKLGVGRGMVQSNQIALVGAGVIGQPGGSGDNVILVKGDQSGKGPGAGGHKGQKKGGHHGKQPEGKDNPGKEGKGKGKT